MFKNRGIILTLIILLLTLMTYDIYARGGGGRGGGRSVSRSGAASGGNFSSGRSSRSTNRSSSINRSSRPSQMDRSRVNQNQAGSRIQNSGSIKDRQSNIGSKNKDWQQNRQDWKDQNREDWQDYGRNGQEDRQDFMYNRQEDRQDYANRYSNQRWYYDDDWYGHHHYDYWGSGAAFATGLVIGATLSAAAFNSGYPSGCATVNYGNVIYYNCGATWYEKVYRGGTVNYLVVNPPY